MTEWDLRPARDLGLPAGFRLRSHSREVGLIGLLTNAAWRAAARSYLAAAHRLKVSGRAHVPVEPPFIMVANHTSHLDALTLSTVLPGPLARRAVSLAAGEVFFGKIANAAFAATALNALPIWRWQTTPADLDFLRLRLEEDRLVFILFPEGTRARDGVMGRFRVGLGALVAGSKVPVLPCYLRGAYDCWPAGRRLPRPGPLHLQIGAPLLFDGLPNDRTGWVQVARATERAVRGLGALDADKR